MIRLLGDVQRLGGGKLQAGGQLVSLDAGLEAIIARARLGVAGIELVDEIDARAMAVLGDEPALGCRSGIGLSRCGKIVVPCELVGRNALAQFLGPLEAYPR